MGTSRRALICALAVAALWPTTARAQAFPNRPIRLIVPFAAGGAADLFGRALANALSAELGQQVVVEVRAGAGGLTGVDALAKSAPDGYTICLAGAAALSAIPFMVSKMPFDWRKDLALLTLAVRVPEVLIVHPALGVDTLEPFISTAKMFDKGLFVLVRTSNPGSAEFQDVRLADGRTWSEMMYGRRYSIL